MGLLGFVVLVCVWVYFSCFCGGCLCQCLHSDPPWPCFRKLACCSTSALSIFAHWEFGSLLHPCSLGQVPCSTPSWLLVLDYNLLFMLSSFVRGGFNLPKGCTALCSLGVGKGVPCGSSCSTVGSAGLCRQL
jgi:hypothetical protein